MSEASKTSTLAFLETLPDGTLRIVPLARSEDFPGITEAAGKGVAVDRTCATSDDVSALTPKQAFERIQACLRDANAKRKKKE